MSAQHPRKVATTAVQHMSASDRSRYVLREQDRHDDILAVEEMPEPLPLVDLSQLRAADEASKLQAALESWGLFLATGHGIEGSLMNALTDGAREFFHQPLEMKQRFSNLVDGKPQLEGYGTDGAMSQDETLDWKDRLYLTIDPAEERDPSRWPDYPQHFRDAVHEYAKKSKEIRDVVLRAIARLLELEEDYFIHKFTDRATTFARFNYYPSCASPDHVFGFRPHSDGRMLTIVLVDKEVGGLQVRRAGRWYNVPTIPGTLVIFVGDSLEIMNNGIFKAAVHRVVTNPVKDRISLVMFFGVDGDTMLEPAPSLLDAARPARYRKMRANEYGMGVVEYHSRGERMIESMKI